MSQGWVVSPAVQLSAAPNPNISQPSLAFVNLIRIGATDLQERVYSHWRKHIGRTKKELMILFWPACPVLSLGISSFIHKFHRENSKASWSALGLGPGSYGWKQPNSPLIALHCTMLHSANYEPWMNKPKRIYKPKAPLVRTTLGPTLSQHKVSTKTNMSNQYFNLRRITVYGKNCLVELLD